MKFRRRVMTMTKMRRREQSRIQCVASSGDLTPTAVARLLRSLATCRAELVAVRVVTDVRPTLLAALDAMSSEVKTEVHVRGETTRPTAPELWDLLRSDVVQLHGIAIAGSGLDVGVVAEGIGSERGYKIEADVSKPDPSAHDWQRRWQACVREMPDDVEACARDDERVASFEGVAKSLAEVQRAVLALAKISAPQRSMIHWLVAAKSVEALAARRLERAMEAHPVEDGLGLEYQVRGVVNAADLHAMARLLAAREPDLDVEVVIKGAVIETSAGRTLAPGDLVITGSDVAWIPEGRVFGGAIAAVVSHLEKAVGKPLVAIDQTAGELQRAQSAGEVASHAMGLLRGEVPVCDDCGGVVG